MVARLLDGHLHAALADDHAHAMMTVHHRRGLTVPHDLELGDRLLYPRLHDPVVVDRLESSHPVGVDAPLVCADEDGRAGPCVFGGDSHSLEDVDHEALQKIERHVAGFAAQFDLLNPAVFSAKLSVYPR
jgi:hypothetical protein